MWAVMTVVVVFEFSVGATLGKGVNRAIATLLGGALGMAAHDLANLTPAKVEVGLIALSLCVIGFGNVYFEESYDKNLAPLKDFKTVLISKDTEDSLVNFAWWEPRHGKFRYRHPWDQYLKIGSATRECAYKIDALNCYLNSDVQTPLELRTTIQDLCTKISTKCSLALTDVAIGLQTMTCPLSSEKHIMDAKVAAKTLKAILKTELWHDIEFLDIIPVVTVASLLIEIVTCTVKIADSVEVLATKVKFKKPNPEMNRLASLEKVKRIPSIEASLSVNIVFE
ncbi:aluminum-activated malate transporter 2-like [Salvia splendens]|uniref:aluminum-activated malate transporter 2-like n=1 Tax=Salvia splendens TaxID=180675 RepID=UPI001C255CFC|nr:aluminum-activated malate transporter 2-like [Salvia splendens]